MNRQQIRNVLCIVLTVLGSSFLCEVGTAEQPSVGAQPIVVEGATLIDGTGRPPMSDTAIVIVGNRILSVGARTTATYPQGAQVVDARDRYVIPGLIESHAHYPEWAGELFLAYGVTSVIDAGNSTEWIRAMKEVFRKGIARMPRLFSTGEFLGAPSSVSRGIGGQGSALPFMTHVTTPQEARQATRRIIEQGMDAIKVFQNLSPEQLRGITEEAHRANIPVMGHAFDAAEAAELGYDRIEHTHGLRNAAIKSPEGRAALKKGTALSASLLEVERFDHLAELMVRTGTLYDPILIYEYKAVTPRSKAFQDEARALLDHPGLRYIPLDTRVAMAQMYGSARETGTGLFMGPLDRVTAAKRPEYHEGYSKDQEFVRRLVQAGGRVCAGTDAPTTVPGLSLHQELQLLVDAGLSPMQALLAATKNPAAFLRKLDQLGTVEPGKLADLLVLKADPLDDIQNARQIERVMLDGRFVDTAFDADYAVPFARPLPYGVNAAYGFFPQPQITNISPRSALEGDHDFELVVEGSNFTYASAVTFGGQRVPTRFVNPGRLTATVRGDLLTRAGTWFVRVHNPPPGGGDADGYGFVVLYK